MDSALQMGMGTGAYEADIVFCIDSTGSMNPCLDNVKNYANQFGDRMISAMENVGKTVDHLRVKVIDFRDYGDTRAPAMTESGFFNLKGDDDQTAAYSEYVDGLQAKGGGDYPENALEAIVYAMRSDWTTGGMKRRHIIVVFTDDAALDFGARAGAAGYPTDMPANLEELQKMWEGETPVGTFQKESARLIIFAPAANPWSEFETWERVFVNNVSKNNGMADVDMDDVMKAIVRSFVVETEQ